MYTEAMTEAMRSVLLVEGTADTLQAVLNYLKKSGIETKANPDLYIREYSQFAVDDARELVSRANSRAFRDRRVFIIIAASMNIEAQNTLLKTLEEPPADALFVFVVPSPHMLLPTLRSRVQILKLEGADDTMGAIDAGKFLQSAKKERIAILKPLLERDKNDERSLSGIISFLAALERETGSDAVKNAEGLKAIYRARKYIGDKGALLKPLLEQVALLV